VCVGLVVKTRIGREVPCLDVPLAKIDAVKVALGGQSTVLLGRLGLVAGVQRGAERRGKRGGRVGFVVVHGRWGAVRVCETRPCSLSSDRFT
jgi:hypothetical protein